MSETKKKVKKGVDKLARALDTVDKSGIIRTGKDFP